MENPRLEPRTFRNMEACSRHYETYPLLNYKPITWWPAPFADKNSVGCTETCFPSKALVRPYTAFADVPSLPVGFVCHHHKIIATLNETVHVTHLVQEGLSFPLNWCFSWAAGFLFLPEMFENAIVCVNFLENSSRLLNVLVSGWRRSYDGRSQAR